MIRTVFILPLAEGDVCRVNYTIQSIRSNCIDYKIAIVLDGVKSIESVATGDDISFHDAEYLSKGHWGAIWLNQMKVMKYYALSDLTNENTLYIKIDSDALVLRKGIYERAHTLFQSRPKIGQLGQVYSDCVGNRLKNAGWQNFYEKTYGLRGLKLFLTGKTHSPEYEVSILTRVKSWLRYRKYIRDNDEPHTYGIGGCYILSDACVHSIIDTGVIEEKTFLLTPDFGEDALMGLLVGSVGYTKLDDVADQGLFAVGGLYNKTTDTFRANPVEIAKRGHYIIHPFKFGYVCDNFTMSEDELVQILIQKST